MRKLATCFRALGVAPGDRVVAYLPNSPEAVIAMLATASIGAIWASCGPDFGSRGVVDRFLQLAPKIAICVDGYFYGGKPFDRRPELKAILSSLPSIEQVIYLRQLDPESDAPLTGHTLFWEDALAGPEVPRESFRFEQVPFAHPLWILFSSGTTGLPKPIMHCHGAMILEQIKSLTLHMDLHPRERMFFYTTTGWMMWNFLASALLVDVVPVLYDGNPAYPAPDVLWAMVERTGASFFGASPTYVGILEKAGIVPKDRFDLKRLKSVMLAGSPVTAECMAWFYRNVKSDLWAHSGSGGTDLCTGIVGGDRDLTAVCRGNSGAGAWHGGVRLQRKRGGGRRRGRRAGHHQARALDARRLLERCRRHALPGVVFRSVSRSVAAWRFLQGQPARRLLRARSIRCDFESPRRAHRDRRGVSGAHEVPEIEDALIVNLDLKSGGFFMPLFVKLHDGIELDEPLREKVRARMRRAYSARHVPDKIYQVGAIPYTLTGKKMEVPVRRILMGVPVEKAANRAAMANVESLDYFIRYAREQQDYRL